MAAKNIAEIIKNKITGFGQSSNPYALERFTPVTCFSNDIMKLIPEKHRIPNVPVQVDDPLIPNYINNKTNATTHLKWSPGRDWKPNRNEPAFLWPGEVYSEINQAIRAAEDQAPKDCDQCDTIEIILKIQDNEDSSISMSKLLREEMGEWGRIYYNYKNTYNCAKKACNDKMLDDRLIDETGSGYEGSGRGGNYPENPPANRGLGYDYKP